MTRGSIFQSVQVGAETTAGTAVAASKRLLGLSIQPTNKSEVKLFRPMGSKFKTVATLNKEWSEAALSGPITFTDIVYALCAGVVNVAPTGTTAKTWVFSPALSAADAIKTLTVESGDATRAQKFTYGMVNALTLKFSRTGNEISGSMIGKAATDGITLTATPTDVSLIPVMPTQVSYKLADTQAGLAGASVLPNVIDAEWSLSGRFAPAWFMDGATSFSSHVETEPELDIKFRMEADATALGLLTTMRNAATKFLRIEATGALISGGDYYSLKIDTALKMTEPTSYEDVDGVYAYGWSAKGVYDSTWTKTTEITVVNTVAAL